ADSPVVQLVQQKLNEVEAVFDAATQRATQSLTGFSMPSSDKTAAEGLTETYAHILRVADAQANLNGVTTDTRDAYAEALDVLERMHKTLEEGSDDWLLVADAIVSTRRELDSINETLVETEFNLTSLRELGNDLATGFGDW